MNDFRAITREQVAASLQDAERRAFPDALGRTAVQEWRDRYVTGPLPQDRPGLLAAIHPLIAAQLTAGMWWGLAAVIAGTSGQRVYILVDEWHWTLLAFAGDDGEPPDLADGTFQNYQAVEYLEPDGLRVFVSAS